MKKPKTGDLVSLKDGLQVGDTYGHLELLEGMKFESYERVNYARKNSVDIGKWTYSMEMLDLAEMMTVTHSPIKLKRERAEVCQ